MSHDVLVRYCPFEYKYEYKKPKIVLELYSSMTEYKYQVLHLC